MYYQIQSLNLLEIEIQDPSFEDSVKTLPDGNLILIRDIKKALNNEGFFYYNDLGQKATEALPFSKEEMSYYLNVFYHTLDFGLPHGRGWLHELPWVLQIVSHLKVVYNLIKNYHQEDAIKRTGSASSISASIF